MSEDDFDLTAKPKAKTSVPKEEPEPKKSSPRKQIVKLEKSNEIESLKNTINQLNNRLTETIVNLNNQLEEFKKEVPIKNDIHGDEFNNCIVTLNPDYNL